MTRKPRSTLFAPPSQYDRRAAHGPSSQPPYRRRHPCHEGARPQDLDALCHDAGRGRGRRSGGHRHAVDRGPLLLARYARGGGRLLRPGGPALRPFRGPGDRRGLSSRRVPVHGHRRRLLLLRGLAQDPEGALRQRCAGRRTCRADPLAKHMDRRLQGRRQDRDQRAGGVGSRQTARGHRMFRRRAGGGARPGGRPDHEAARR